MTPTIDAKIIVSLQESMAQLLSVATDPATSGEQLTRAVALGIVQLGAGLSLLLVQLPIDVDTIPREGR